MNSIVEECPVCWRSFGAEIIPTTLICGHSMCFDCSENLRKCPLCRRRLSSNSAKAPNHTLLFLIDRLEHLNTREKKDQQNQTDDRNTHTRVLKSENISQPVSGLEAITLSKKGLTFKLKSNRAGVLNGFEVRF